MSSERLLTPAEVMARLQISRRTFHRLRATGRLPFTKIGGAVRCSEADVAAAIARGRPAEATPTQEAAPAPPRFALEPTSIDRLPPGISPINPLTGEPWSAAARRLLAASTGTQPGPARVGSTERTRTG